MLRRIGLTVPDADLFRSRADVAMLDAMLDSVTAYESYADKFYCVAEILSDSNTDKDIAVKRQRYLQHPDNLYFLLIDQKRVAGGALRTRGRVAAGNPRRTGREARSARLRLRDCARRALSRHATGTA